MNDRLQKIDAFLKNFFLVAKNNPDLAVDKELIYANFIYDGRHDNIENYFSYWITNFQNKNNIEVFTTERMKGFCHFTNYKESVKNKDHIKMYVSYDAEHIYQNATKIFEFLANNDIAHISKVANHTRNDDVVIRVGSIEDAKIIANYINSTPELLSGRRDCVLFDYNENGIGYAIDYQLSFNSVSSKLVSEYISLKAAELSSEYQINQVGIEDFKIFLINKLNNIEKEDSQSDTEFTNTLEIISLFIKILDQNYNLEEFYEDYSKREYSKSNTVLHSDDSNIDTQIDQFEINKAEFLNKFNSVIFTMLKKYGYDITVNTFEKYIENGEITSFTRDNKARLTMHMTSYEEFKNQLNYYYGDCSVDSIYKLLNDSIELLLGEVKNAIAKTGEKYGKNQSIYAVKKLVSQGTFDGFSRDDNCRGNLENTNVDSSAISILLKYINNDNLNNQSNIASYIEASEIVDSLASYNNNFR